MRRRPRIAVIGAGVAGLCAAREMVAAGAAVAIYEKSRGLGGRLATRRPFGRDDPTGVDHGAPVASASDPEILAALSELGPPYAPQGGPSLGVVGVPGMSDLVKPLAEGLAIERETEIAEIARGPEDWMLIDKANGRHGPFDAVAVATPAPQAANLLGDACPDVGAAEMAPCWTLLLAFDASLQAPLELFRPQGGPFELILNNSAKPSRGGNGGVECWVAHARADWSAARIETEKDDMAPLLLGAFGDAIGVQSPTPRYLAAHRWRYARVAQAVGRAFWLSDDGGLGACGDWRLGANVGDAWRSGTLLGRAMAKAAHTRIA